MKRMTELVASMYFSDGDGLTHEQLEQLTNYIHLGYDITFDIGENGVCISIEKEANE